MSNHDNTKELLEELSIVQIQANTYEKNYKEAVEEIARLKMKISAADGDDWKKKYKHLLYKVIPRMSAQEELYIEAIKKLISERDQALKDLDMQEDCLSCKYFQAKADPTNRCDLNHGYAGDRYQCRWAWRGVQNEPNRQK